MYYRIYDFTTDKFIPSHTDIYIRYASYVKEVIEEEKLNLSSFVYIYEENKPIPIKILPYEEFLGFYIEQNKLEENIKSVLVRF